MTDRYINKAIVENAWLKDFYDKAKHDGWLIKIDNDEKCHVVNKQCVVFLGIPIVYMKSIYQQKATNK